MRFAPGLILSALTVAGMAHPAMADCANGQELLFRCHIVERKAIVELCRGEDATSYSYQSQGKVELQFAGTPWGLMKRDVRGINGTAYGSGVQNGDTFYAVFIDGQFQGMDGQRLHSPNPAVVQVYASQADATDFEHDEPIARRVCYPPSIQVDSPNFGPG